MANAFTLGKCYEFGKLLKTNYEGAWQDLIKDPEWKKWKKARELTDKQVQMTKRGYMGLLFSGEEVVLDSPLDEEIFPFGTYKGRRFKELPDRYIKWLSQQDWLEKWSTVHQYVNKRLSVLTPKDTASPEEIKTILQKIQ